MPSLERFVFSPGKAPVQAAYLLLLPPFLLYFLHLFHLVPYVPVVLKIRVETLNNRTSLLYSQKFTPPTKRGTRRRDINCGGDAR